MAGLAKQDRIDTVDIDIPPIPLAKMLEYRAQKLSYDEIGKIVGCTRQNVQHRLAGYKEHIDSLDAFKERKADVMQVKQSMLLSHLTPDVIKGMSGFQTVGSFALLFDKTRLEEGRSTSNVSLADAALRLSEGLEGLEKELSNLPADLDGEG